MPEASRFGRLGLLVLSVLVLVIDQLSKAHFEGALEIVCSHFDSPLAPRGDTRFDTTPGAAKAFSELANERHFTSTQVPPA